MTNERLRQFDEFIAKAGGNLHHVRRVLYLSQLIAREENLAYDEDVLAFGLMMIRLGSCLTCDLDSYRASLGCCTCARRTISGYKEDDSALLELFDKSLAEVRAFIEKQQPLSVSLLLEEALPVTSDRLM